MCEPCTFTELTVPSVSSPSMQTEYPFPGEVSAISNLLDNFILVLTECSWISGNEGEVETAVPEALHNTVLHGNHEDRRKCVRVTCRPESRGISTTDETKAEDLILIRSRTPQLQERPTPVEAAAFA
jgi:hypothetical protein